MILPLMQPGDSGAGYIILATVRPARNAARGVAHLDAKPSNIIMGMAPCLIDLSIARSFEDAAALTAQIGTHAYMAPEQCEPLAQPGRIGAPADVWGLGVTLYQATTGKLPFARPGTEKTEDPAKQFPQILDDPAPLPKHLPSALIGLIERMMHKDPMARPTASRVAESLQALVFSYPKKRKRKKIASARNNLKSPLARAPLYRITLQELVDRSALAKGSGRGFPNRSPLAILAAAAKFTFVRNYLNGLGRSCRSMR